MKQFLVMFSVISLATMIACGDGDPVTGDDVLQPEVSNLECGPGTVEVDGQCVISEEAAADLLKAEVASVKVKSLQISEEGERAIYPEHPLHASITLEIETLDELETTVVLGLESKDGAKRCVVGYWTLDATAPVAEGDVTPIQTLTLNQQFYVQPSCDVLIGETEVRAWVSFDPFAHTIIPGRTIVAQNDAAVTDFLQQSRLTLDGCTAAESPHPESCETALEVLASPGRDVELVKAALSSNVAILEVPDFVPEYTEESFTDGDGNVVEIQQPEQIKPLSTSPHFIVNADMRVFGLDGSDEDVVEDGEMSLTFAIRPLLDPEQETELSAAALDWQPLFAEIQDEPKAGEEPTINLIEQEFMKSMVGGQALVRTSPIFITGNAEAFIARGVWADFNKFELRICAASDFEEKGAAEDALENNCKSSEVFVIRKEVRADSTDEDQTNATYTDGIKISQTYGNSEKVAVKFTLNGELKSANDGVAAGALLGAYLLGWFEMTLFEAFVHGWDYFDSRVPDRIIPGLTIFGYVMPTRKFETDFPVGQTELAGISFTAASPAVRFGFDLGIVFVGISAHAEGTLGISAYLEREEMAASGTNPKCSASGAVTSGNYCYKAVNTTKTFTEAVDACRKDNGWLAAADSMTTANAIMQTRTSAGITNAYLWVDGRGMSCVKMASGLNSVCDIMFNLMKIVDPVNATAIRDNCYQRNQVEIDKCLALHSDPSQWRWFMPSKGSVMTSGVPFAAGSPDDAAPGEDRMALKSSKEFVDMGEGAKLPYVCQYPKTYSAGGKVSAVVEPYATLTLVGTAGISLLLVGADLWVAIDLLTAALPLTGSVQWYSGTPILTLAIAKLEFVLRGLGGAIGATLWAKPGGSWTVTIFEWDSIDYGRWLLGQSLPQWRSQ